MPKKKKSDQPVILAPVDFSDNSEAALVQAAEIADAFGAPLQVLHVVHDLGEAPGFYAVKGRKKQLRRMEDVAADMLTEFMQLMVEKHPDLSALAEAETRLVKGLPVSRILEVVEMVRPRMVVLGSQGRTGLARLFLGSKAEQCVRLCPSPVLIVKREEAAA